jgi:signal transduction histidine kinase/HAMP domain-containing protein
MKIWNFFNSSIQRKLLLSFILVVLVFGVIVIPIAYYSASNALTTESFEAVRALAATRQSQFIQWIDDLRVNMLALSHNEAVITASRAFRNTIDTSQELGLTNEARLSSLGDAFIGQPDLVDAEDLSSPYRAVHQRFHQFFRDLQLVYGYSDILLVNVAGDVIYSSNKNADVFSNIVDGQYSNTGLGDAVQQVLSAGENHEQDFMVFVDFSNYPVTGEPTAFIASSLNGENEFLGVLVYAIPIELIEEILNFRVGFGETGESYVIGSDNLPRSNLALQGIEGSAVLNPLAVVSTDVVNAALDGEENVGFNSNYRGVDVLSAWQPVILEEPNAYGSDGVTWALVSEITVAEAIAPANELILYMGLGLAAGGAVVLVLSFAISRQIAVPIVELTHSVERVSQGDFKLDLKIHSQDEIGLLSKAFLVMGEELNDLISNLGFRVAERTRDIEVASNVAREISNELDLAKLLPSIVEQTREGFDLYHVSIYLYAPETEQLLYTGGTGEVGVLMGEAGWKFHINDKSGIVPQAGRSKEAVLVSDTRSSVVHYANQWLPDTRSELALPIMLRDQLIGVLDLQSTKLDAFDEGDLRVMTSLVQQLAIAIQNARLYANQVRISEGLRKVDRMKTEFMANMSHELRTPLNPIINYPIFLNRGDFGPVTEQQIYYIEDIRISGNYLLQMINDVLDQAKIESGTMTLFVEEIDVRKCVTEAVKMGDIHNEKLVRDGEEKNYKMIVEVADGLPLVVADEKCVTQVLVNFVTNAVKATETGFIRISVNATDKDLVIKVQDTGRGILPEHFEQIFKPFEQVNEGKAKRSGTGLGLPISKRLVEAHFGQISVESIFGEGATFTATLPLRHPDLELALHQSKTIAVSSI